MAFVRGLMLRWTVGEMKIFDMCFQGWLIILYREHIVRFFFPRPDIGLFLAGYAEHRE